MRFASASMYLFAAAALSMAAPVRAQSSLSALVGAGDALPAPWHVVGLPGQTKPFTRFAVADIDGHRAVRIEADSSYGNLVHPLQDAPAGHLAWQWRVERPLTATDLRQKSGDDTEVKVCVFFDEPMDKLSFGDRQLLRFARSRSSEPLPSATLCYVWDAKIAAGTALDNAFTRRVRYIVVESGNGRLNQWVAERRDIRADFARTFGDECDTMPPVIGVAIGADADNTHGHSIAYVAGLTLGP
ncbi:MAG: DUF3047 domain-containing protein [Caldimonas sp.]